MRTLSVRAIAMATVFAVIVASCAKKGSGIEPEQTDSFTGTYAAATHVQGAGGGDYPQTEFTVSKKGGKYSLRGAVPAAAGTITIDIALTDVVLLEGEMAGACGFSIAPQAVGVGAGSMTMAGICSVSDANGEFWDGILSNGGGEKRISLVIETLGAVPEDWIRITVSNMY